MSLSTELIYSPLKEDLDNTSGWNKSTIEYITNHQNKIKRTIQSICKKLGYKIQKIEVDDIYGKLVMFCHSSSDYSIDKAYASYGEDERTTSFNGFMHKNIEYCIKRYVSERGEHEKRRAKNILNDENDKEISILDHIEDKTAEERMYGSLTEDLDSICKRLEWRRYMLGVDIFQVMFVKCIAVYYNKQQVADIILETLGDARKDIKAACSQKGEADLMLVLATEISDTNLKDAIDILRKYTYGADKLEKAVLEYELEGCDIGGATPTETDKATNKATNKATDKATDKATNKATDKVNTKNIA